MKPFDANKGLRKLKTKQNINNYIIYGTFVVSLLLFVATVIFLTRATYTSRHDFEIINAKVGDFSGDVKILAYNYDNESHAIPPTKSSDYIADSVDCTNATGTWDNDRWALVVENITGKVKCNISFIHPYRYWTDNYSYTQYDPTSAPTTTYENYTSIVGSDTVKTYIRTKYSNGNPVEHYVCFYYSGERYCLTVNYWADNGGSQETVTAALQRNMATALGIPTSSLNCSSSTAAATCMIGEAYCKAEAKGGVTCYDGAKTCNIMYTNKARCYQ